MKLIFTSYVSSPEYNQPDLWLKRIEGYAGILEMLGKDHTVIGIERINYEGEYLQNNVQYIFTRQKKKVIRFPWRMHRFIKKQKPDVVFVNGLIFPLQVLQLRFVLGNSVKIIGIHHAEKPFNGLKKELQRLADSCMNAYLFTSLEFGKEWVQNGNISSLKKIYEVMEASSAFYPSDRNENLKQLSVKGHPIYLWVGRLNTNKDPLTVVKAFLLFQQKHISARLYMIYHEQDLLQDIKQLMSQYENAGDVIRLIGNIPHEQMTDWYNNADFIISGSHYEGSGVAVCEAMSCGCIPVLTDIFSFRMMTGRGKCGLLYQPGNDNELLAALLKTMEMDLEKEKVKVLQQFKEELSFEAIGWKIEQVIAKLNKK
jgi:glycosyltransferase involved in cell wall biosynthesis